MADDFSVIILRNPYHNLASSIRYLESGGECKDIVMDENFERIWIEHASEAKQTIHLNRGTKVIILYDLFIKFPIYRQKKSKLLGLDPKDEYLGGLAMGGGSSFGKGNYSYTSRANGYKSHPAMLRIQENSKVKRLWEHLYASESTLCV